ncbi:hypothetical protein MAPG_12003 [Magnaporthiopsis poae ATCC 64411]|uniref:Retrovirus-related Pol polyprotein from transposon TNT 1-94-like beta-barrel domain-containing protein n=1 Tax=Magnaporthiopsis poae (strain ATCC 64411 / 73-15) TaxID=644358 RepID=A0A0C4EGM9_MAGP6|nr:hypothetical protein MAPG_12003 [Magnaporthiopsis poae ATCC 64411]
MATPSETSGLCPDWVLSTSSNVHVARDRAWFSTYTPFPTFTTSYVATSGPEALGIGDVHLPVKLFPKRSGPGAHGTLHLRDVLHVPTSVCNIIGSPGTGDYSGITFAGLGDDGKDGAITAQNGRRLGYFVGRRLMVLKLSGPPIGPAVGPSALETGTHYMIGATWPDSERQRWAAAQADHATNQGEPAAGPSAPYTQKEKAWLKREWGGEFKFLAAYGLSIYKDEDREEGRSIARAMMEADEVEDTSM